MLHVDLNEAFSASTQPLQGARPRCLLVEDSLFDRRRVQQLAERARLDLDITEATTLRDARREMSRQSFDLVLLDNLLPDGEAMSALRDWRSDSASADVPIIMMSGQRETSLGEQALTAGCSAYLDKNALDSQSFRAAIERALDAVLKNPAVADAAGARQVRLALEAFAGECVNELRAPASRMLRQLHLAREKHPEAQAEFDRMIDTCHQIFSRLDEIGDFTR